MSNKHDTLTYTKNVKNILFATKNIARKYEKIESREQI